MKLHFILSAFVLRVLIPETLNGAPANRKSNKAAMRFFIVPLSFYRFMNAIALMELHGLHKQYICYNLLDSALRESFGLWQSFYRIVNKTVSRPLPLAAVHT
jgi:hypothetical protein